MNQVLFLCTGNYYRSRFAEFYFRHLASRTGLHWSADSRGLALDPWNPGPMSTYTEQACRRLGISVEPVRLPRPLEESDLSSSQLVIAVKEAEHRPLMRRKFPHWEDRVEYWQVHDLDFASPDEALPQLQQLVELLVNRLRQTRPDASAEPCV